MKDFKETITFVDIENKFVGGNFKPKDLKSKDNVSLKELCLIEGVDYLDY